MMILTQRSTLGRRTLWMTSLLFSCALWGAACSESGGGPDPGTNKPDIDAPDSYGDTCIDDDDVCVDGMECFSYGSEVDDRFCSMQCVNDDSCPEESSCLSLNAADGLIKLCVPNDLCIDPDEDQYGSGPGCKGPDCDQTNSLINPGAPELCDGIDNNCDGLIDNDTVDARETCDTGLMGVCNDGWYVCRDANLVCEPNIQPGERQEICDGLDNDCDGLVDEGAEEDENNNWVTGIGRPCGNPDDVCFGGYQVCNSEARQLECDDPVEPLDIPDYCTGRDDNCNGEVDEDANDPDNLLGTPCYDGIGTCRAAATWSCDPDDPEAEPVCPAKAREENATTEVCDYTDNDCDGVVDNGFRNSDGVYDQIENCGQCGNDCNERFGGDPAARGLKVECKVTGSQARCASECLPGRYDLDKVPANGCEFEPDLDAIYVAKEVRDGTQGEDTNSCGTFDAPCRTIEHAISRASSGSKPRVRVAEGIFKEAITLSNGISVMGGHSSRNWILDPAANTTTLQGGIAMGNHVTTVRAESITSATEFSGFTIDARDAQPGGNSYGIYIKDSNSSLTVKDNIVIAGRGGVGTAAGNGSSGETGADGTNGLDRKNYDSSCSSRPSPLLAGGAGGQNTCGNTNVSGGSAVDITVCPNNTAGQPINNTSERGAKGQGTQGGNGGISSRHTERGGSSGGGSSGGNYLCHDGFGVSSPGLDGGFGNNGPAGSGAGNANGTVNADHWIGNSGANGGNGTPGSGGGGAGSSGGIQDDRANYDVHYGPTGGGGGAGGCGGNGGEGGHAGGASFGIFVLFSGNSSNVPSITNNEITRGLGGRGGTGGAGGAGGSGGSGGEGGEMFADAGNYTRCGQNGQRGGTGGAGGHGGGGGGGAGGASFDIATGGNNNNAVNAYQGANTYTQGNGEATGGQGGAGGTSIGNAGAAGAQGASGNFRRF